MNGLFGQPDMTTMRMPEQMPFQLPASMPSMPMPQRNVPQDMGEIPSDIANVPAEMPMVNGVPENAMGAQQMPTYVGNPMVDKYIHMFIGA